MTTRKVLQISSEKKRDTMLGAFGSGADWNTSGNTIIGGDGQYHTIMWCPTARYRHENEEQRNRTTTFIKGFADHLTVTSPNAVVFMWRRIVFRSHVIYSEALSQSTSNGVIYYRNMNVDQSQAQIMIEDILRGQAGQDWVDAGNAVVDTRQVELISDKTRYIRPEGAFGDIKTFKMYYPINKNMTYDDEERNGGTESSPWAAPGRTHGNVYVIDLFRSNISTQANAALNLRMQSTLYWHEK